MKLAIISFAHIHANNYAGCIKEMKDVELVAIADEEVERGEDVAKIFNTKYYQDYRDILKKEDINAVIVTSANSQHHKMVIDCANKGLHTLCEKPIATTIEDAKEMIKVCEERNVILQQAFPMRYSPAVKIIKESIERGMLGKILAIKGKNRGKMPDPNIYPFFTCKDLAGGGAVMDHTVHVADLMRWILGSEVKEVYAEVDRLIHKNIDVDDCGIISLEFEDGTIATLDPSWSRPESFPTWGDVTMDFIGTDGVVTLSAFAQTTSLYNDKTGKISWNYFGSNLDFLMIFDFVNSVKNNLKPKVTGYDGLKALEIALSAYKSQRLGQPVKLPL